MTKQIRRIEVFISSPSSLKDEREIIDEICYEINLDRGTRDDFVVSPIKWETHSRPGMGADVQSVVSDQLGYEFDIYLGILGAKFGTKTANFGSGTEEEFEESVKSHEAGTGVSEIFFYFKDPKESSEPLDGREYAQVQDFQKNIGSRGLKYEEFSTTSDFKLKVTRHLNQAITKILETKINTPQVRLNGESKASHQINPLENLEALMEDEDGHGLYDLVNEATKYFGEFTSDASAIASATEVLANSFVERTEQINKISKTIDKSSKNKAERIFNLAARDMEKYTSALTKKLPNINMNMNNALEFSQRAIIMMDQHFEVDKTELNELSNNLAGMDSSLLDSISAIVDFQENISKFPPVNSVIKKAKRRMFAINKDMLAFFERARVQLSEVLETIPEV